MTVCLEGRCSIQLSYSTNKKGGWVTSPMSGVAGFEPATSCSQSRRDDRATLHPDELVIFSFPNNLESACKSNHFNSFYKHCGETGIRTPGTRLGYACLANKSFRPLRHLSMFNERRAKIRILMLRIKKK